MAGEYPKIQSVYLREPPKFKRLLLGQYAKPEFEYLAGCQWLWDEKIDGMNIRVFVEPGGVIRFGGRTDAAQIPAPLVARLEERFLPQAGKLAEMFADGAVLFGEGYGPKIQKGGGLYREDQDFILFDCRVGAWWLKRDALMEVAGKLGLDFAPVVGRGTLPELVEFVRHGFPSVLAKEPRQAEGVVARPAVALRDRAGERIITKLKTCDFEAA